MLENAKTEAADRGEAPPRAATRAPVGGSTLGRARDAGGLLQECCGNFIMPGLAEIRDPDQQAASFLSGAVRSATASPTQATPRCHLNTRENRELPKPKGGYR